MGTYYTIGIINEFKAEYSDPLTEQEWVRLLNERINTDVYDLSFSGKKIEGKMKEGIFKDNIRDFYDLLTRILGKNKNGNFEYYYKGGRDDIEEYSIEDTGFTIAYDNNKQLDIAVSYAMLFIEGKVLVEEFYTDPVLINYLFRNCTLSGCVISEVVG